MRIGYARVSADEQSLDLQLDALKKAGYKRVFTDKASAAKWERPGLTDALSHTRSDDVLVIWKLDRLGRTVKGPVEFVAELQDQGVRFRSLTDGIDTWNRPGSSFGAGWCRGTWPRTSASPSQRSTAGSRRGACNSFDFDRDHLGGPLP